MLQFSVGRRRSPECSWIWWYWRMPKTTCSNKGNGGTTSATSKFVQGHWC